MTLKARLQRSFFHCHYLVVQAAAWQPARKQNGDAPFSKESSTMKNRFFVSIMFVAAVTGGMFTLCGCPTLSSGPIRLVNVQNSMCLQPDKGSTSQGTAIVQQPCNGSLEQQWSTANGSSGSAVHIVNAASKLCLDARGGATSGTPIQQWTCDSITNENWSFGITNNLLSSGVSGSYSDCIAASTNQAGQAMELQTCNTQSPAQQWKRPAA
jgi:hypothetical protein